MLKPIQNQSKCLKLCFQAVHKYGHEYGVYQNK